MRLKRGFSLAEILIAVIFLGIVATLTIPNTMKGMARKRNIVAYKTAYSKISQVVASMQDENGNIMTGANEDEAARIWKAMDGALASQAYYSVSPSKTTLVDLKNLSYKATWNNITVGDGDNPITQNNGAAPWIITAGGISYTIETCSTCNQQCKSTKAINSAKNVKAATEASCAVIVVDVNGLDNSPNYISGRDSGSYIKPSAASFSDDTKYEEALEKLDRYRIYVGSDGITSGGPYLETGRMLNEKHI